MRNYDPTVDGWRALPGSAMPGGLGIPWAKKLGDQWHYGLLTGREHANPNGVVHGGVLMAFADHGLSFLAWEAAERAPCTTIQLNTHFLDAITPGEFIELRGEVTRRTRGLVFVRGVIGVRARGRLPADDSVRAQDGAQASGGTRAAERVRDVGAIDGIWRVLRTA